MPQLRSFTDAALLKRERKILSSIPESHGKPQETFSSSKDTQRRLARCPIPSRDPRAAYRASSGGGRRRRRRGRRCAAPGTHPPRRSRRGGWGAPAPAPAARPATPAARSAAQPPRRPAGAAQVPWQVALGNEAALGARPHRLYSAWPGPRGGAGPAGGAAPPGSLPGSGCGAGGEERPVPAGRSGRSRQGSGVRLPSLSSCRGRPRCGLAGLCLFVSS